MSPAAGQGAKRSSRPTATYKIFRAGLLTKWESVCEKAARFATRIGPNRVISISHSADQNYAVVTVWYWSK